MRLEGSQVRLAVLVAGQLGQHFHAALPGDGRTVGEFQCKMMDFTMKNGNFMGFQWGFTVVGS